MSLISVIVPVYNVSRYLARFRRSLENQTLRDYEVVCVDDASDDDGMAQLEGWASQDSRVRIYRQTMRLGAGAARNRGLTEARGATVCFADPDDTLPPESLDVRYRAFLAHGLPVRGAYRKVAEDGCSLFVEPVPRGLEGVVCPRAKASSLSQNYFLAGHWTWLIPLDLIRTHGVRNAEGTRTAEDIEFLVQLFFHVQRCCCLRDVVYNWHVRPGSATNRPYTELYYADYLGTVESFYNRALYHGDRELGDLFADENLRWICEHLWLGLEQQRISEPDARAVIRRMVRICARYGMFRRFPPGREGRLAGLFGLRRTMRKGGAGRKLVLPALLGAQIEGICRQAGKPAACRRVPDIPSAPSRISRLHRLEHKLEALRTRAAQGKPLVVLFLVNRASCWQYDGLYRLMQNSPDFKPHIGIVPFTAFDRKDILRNMKLCQQRFFGKEYHAVNVWNEDDDTILDLKEILLPDIVFFTDPWESTIEQYSIMNFFKDSLTCYIPYGMYCANIQKNQYNMMFHRFLDFFFCETEIHKYMAKKYGSFLNGNLVVCGYVKIDPLFEKKENCSYKWKINSEEIKKIIWSPHYSIHKNDNCLGYSCFLELSEFMLSVARHYSEKIQWVFKPHPNLKPTLAFLPSWGWKKAERYWNEWQGLPNACVEEGDYLDLFLTSDAMILDSVSFISEYTATGKPALFTVRDSGIYRKWNEYGEKAFGMLYHANDLKKDIVKFIENVVIKNNDVKKEQRNEFIKSYLVPPNGRTSSENVFTFLHNLFI